MVAEILAGQHTDALPDIYQAVLKVISADDMRVRWKLPYEDLVITEDNFTVGECIDVEEAVGLSWANISPGRSARLTAAILIAALKGRRGMTHDDAKELVDAIPATHLAEMIENYVEAESPLDQTMKVGEDGAPFD